MIGGRPFIGASKPLAPGAKLVDIGCGTGVATLQLASMFPAATIYGIDLSPVPQAVKQMAPENVHFVQGNILDVNLEDPSEGVVSREVFTPRNLDYIFGRMLFLGISDWKRYFYTAAESLKPGAIIEHQDLDWKFYRVGSSEVLSENWPWWNEVVKAVEESGLSTSSGSGAARHLEDSGMEILCIQKHEFSFVPSPQVPNSLAMGRYVQAKLMPQYPELLRKLLGSRIPKKQLDSFIADCLRDLSSEEGIHQKYTVTIARKP
jgi:SAM-dependent methyltransferase